MKKNWSDLFPAIAVIVSLVCTVLALVCTVLCIVALTFVLKAMPTVSANAQSPIGEQTSAMQQAPVASEEPREFVHDLSVIEPLNGTDWRFEMELLNDSDRTLTLHQIVIQNLQDGQPDNEPFVADGQMLLNMGLDNGGGKLTLAPDESYWFGDGHPVVDFMNGRTYSFIFLDENGNEFIHVYPYEMLPAAPPPDYSSDTGKDLLTLRYDADFSVEVGPDMFWVPARALGDSDYANADIYRMLADSPEQKRDKIDTLYEALQLYQVGNFHASDDNIRIEENGIHWEHHKPGYHAVRTNCGCCATSANWLTYILAGDYDEVGYIATSQRDGGGHIFNYIRDGADYYIIDLTHYRTDWVATSVESGNVDDYFATDYIAGNIHRTSDLQNYVAHVQKEYGDPPGLMFAYTAENCLAIDGIGGQNGITITYESPADVQLNVIFDDPNDSLFLQQVPSPAHLPNWSEIPDYPFPTV